MADINMVGLTGRVTRRYEPSGRGPLKLSLEVVDEFNKPDGSPGKSKLFIDCTCWGKLAEECQLQEGDYAAVQGKLASDSYDKDGVKVWKTVLKASAAGYAGSAPVRAVTPRSDAGYSGSGVADW